MFQLKDFSMMRRAFKNINSQESSSAWKMVTKWKIVWQSWNTFSWIPGISGWKSSDFPDFLSTLNSCNFIENCPFGKSRHGGKSPWPNSFISGEFWSMGPPEVTTPPRYSHPLNPKIDLHHSITGSDTLIWNLLLLKRLGFYNSLSSNMEFSSGYQSLQLTYWLCFGSDSHWMRM